MSGWPGGGWAAGVVLKTRPSGGRVAVAVAAVAIVAFGQYQLMEISIGEQARTVTRYPVRF
jgi:hypothetical protein